MLGTGFQLPSWDTSGGSGGGGGGYALSTPFLGYTTSTTRLPGWIRWLSTPFLGYRNYLLRLRGMALLSTPFLGYWSTERNALSGLFSAFNSLLGIPEKQDRPRRWLRRLSTPFLGYLTESPMQKAVQKLSTPFLGYNNTDTESQASSAFQLPSWDTVLKNNNVKM